MFGRVFAPARGTATRAPSGLCWPWQAAPATGARQRWRWRALCAPVRASSRWPAWNRCWRRCLPECCLCPCEAGAEGGIAPESIPRIQRQKATVLLLGPGLGYTAQSAACAAETRTLVQTLLPGFAGSVVLDADGLNAAADLLQAGKTLHPKGELILTPHPGEMARLTGLSAAAIHADREGTALRFARAWNAVVVLKGAQTVIAAPDGRCRVNPTGNPGLSRGGSGDVLAGMTSALLACGLPAFEAAVCAVYLHGAAADRAAAVHGEAGMLPHDLFAALGTLFAENGR